MVVRTALLLLCMLTALPAWAAGYLERLSDIDIRRVHAEEEPNVVFSQLQFDGAVIGSIKQTIENPYSEGNYLLTIDQTFPLFKDMRINNQVRKIIAEEIASFADERIDSYCKGTDSNHDRDWVLHGRYLLFSSGKNCVTVFLTMNKNYCLMNSPDKFIPVVFSTKTGKRLGLKDMFRNPDKARKLMEQYVEGEVRNILAEEKTAFEPNDQKQIKRTMKDFTRFFPTKDGLVLIFYRFEILQGAHSDTFLPIPLEKLMPAGPSKEVWDTVK